MELGTGDSFNYSAGIVHRNVSADETMNLVCKHNRHVVVNAGKYAATVNTGYVERLHRAADLLYLSITAQASLQSSLS